MEELPQVDTLNKISDQSTYSRQRQLLKLRLRRRATLAVLQSTALETWELLANEIIQFRMVVPIMACNHIMEEQLQLHQVFVQDSEVLVVPVRVLGLGQVKSSQNS